MSARKNYQVLNDDLQDIQITSVKPQGILTNANKVDMERKMSVPTNGVSDYQAHANRQYAVDS